MSTKAENQRFATGKLVRRSKSANDCHNELVTLIRKRRRELRFSPGLMSALVKGADAEALGIVNTSPDSDDTGTFRGKLAPGVGEKKSIAWAVRVHEGESSEEIAENTHSTSAETVVESVDLASSYIGLEVESEDTSAD